jgi:hypothetical protein
LDKAPGKGARCGISTRERSNCKRGTIRKRWILGGESLNEAHAATVALFGWSVCYPWFSQFVFPERPNPTSNLHSRLVPSAHSHLQSLNSKISAQLNHSQMVSPQDFASRVRSLTGTTQILHDRGVSAEASGDPSLTQEMYIVPKPQRLRHVMATRSRRPSPECPDSAYTITSRIVAGPTTWLSASQ